MPYIRRAPGFTDASGNPISALDDQLDEPESPAVQTLGNVFTLHFTPTGATGEQYSAGVTTGPASHLRLDVNVDGAGYVNALTTPIVAGTAGVEQTLLLRVAALPHGLIPSDEISVQFWREHSAAADWFA